MKNLHRPEVMKTVFKSMQMTGTIPGDKAKTTVYTCWLCRVIGHKWVTRWKYSMDGLSVSDVFLWGCCVRCGKPTPSRMMDTKDEHAE
jgi:hypothetical protein